MANTRIIIYFFIIISTFIKCDSSNCYKTSPSDKYDCFESISQDDKDDGYHCCYRKNTDSNGNIGYECDICH